ncbi:MAG: GNAT family N-acetyltransferase [Ruminiclostridium sp.]
MSCDIKFENTISAEEFCKLRESVGFQKLTIEQAKTALSNTSLIVNAVCEGKSVGVVRILSDMITDAYITDVIVSPDFQGCGLGRKLMERALAYLKEYSVNNVKLACNLYANPGKEPFYEKLGFKKLPDDKYGYGMLLEL